MAPGLSVLTPEVPGLDTGEDQCALDKGGNDAQPATRITGMMPLRGRADDRESGGDGEGGTVS